MLIKQLSVFLENRLGRFSQVAKILSEAGINMKAFTVSENAEKKLYVTWDDLIERITERYDYIINKKRGILNHINPECPLSIT